MEGVGAERLDAVGEGRVEQGRVNVVNSLNGDVRVEDVREGDEESGVEMMTNVHDEGTKLATGSVGDEDAVSKDSTRQVQSDDEDYDFKGAPLCECAAVTMDRVEIPAKTAVTVRLLPECLVRLRGMSKRRLREFRQQADELPERYTAVFDANERMCEDDSGVRRSRDISDSDYRALAGLEVMGGGFYASSKVVDDKTEEGLALVMVLEKGEAMHIRIENKTAGPMVFREGQEFGVFKLWKSLEGEQEAMEINSVALSDERNEEGSQVEVAGMSGANDGRLTMRTSIEKEFEVLERGLSQLPLEERILRLQSFVNGKWKQASATEGQGLDSSELENLLEMPDMLQRVKPSGWRSSVKTASSQPLELDAMEGERGNTDEEIVDEIARTMVSLTAEYTRQRISQEHQRAIELIVDIKDEELRKRTAESMMTFTSVIGKTTGTGVYKTAESEDNSFGGVLQQTLEAMEVHFVPENPWGIQEGDEEEFELIMRKPIKEADLSEAERAELETLCKKYYDVFRLGSCLTPVKGFEYDLELINPHTRPVFVRPRRINPALLDKAHEHFDALVEKGVCEKADSPWAFALVVAPKRDSETGEFTDCRFCINFCPLNRLIKETTYNYTLIDTVLDDVHASNFVTALDCFSGYHQLALSERTKQMTAFLLEGRGMLRYTTLPFGISSGTAVFSRLMDQVLEGIKGRQCAFIIDDILLHTEGFREHMDKLESIFQRCRRFGLSLKAKKAQFMGTRVNFCGHVIEKGKLGQQEQKVETIKSWPRPRNAADVRSFHGLAAYYRRFVQNFASIAAPLSKIMAADERFVWGPAQEQAFETLKERLAAKTMLVRPDWSKPFILTCDWCNSGIGCCLSQEQDGVEVPICFYSQVLRGAEQRYSATEGECLAVVWAVHKCKEYLQGKPFTLVTDHKALLYILDNSSPEPGAVKNDKIARWAMTLMAYSFDIKFRAGSLNVVADALSRRGKQDLAEERAALAAVEKGDEPGAKRLRAADHFEEEGDGFHDLMMTDKEREKWDDWAELLKAVGGNDRRADVPDSYLVGIYFMHKCVQGLGKSTREEAAEQQVGDWQREMRERRDENLRQASAELFITEMEQQSTEVDLKVLVWGAIEKAQNDMEESTLKFVDAAKATGLEDCTSCIAGLGALQRLRHECQEQRSVGTWTGDCLCVNAVLGTEAEGSFESQVEELRRCVPWLKRRGVRTIVLSVDLECRRWKRSDRDYQRLDDVRAMLASCGFKGDSRFIGIGKVARAGKEIPVRGSYVLMVSSDVDIRKSLRSKWHHAEAVELPMVGRQTDCVAEFNACVVLRQVLRKEFVQPVAMFWAMEGQDDGVVGRMEIPPLEELKKMQYDDEVTKEILEYLRIAGTDATKVEQDASLDAIPWKYRGLARGGQFFVGARGVLMRKDLNERDEATRKPVVVLPALMVPLVLAQYHEGASHLGRRKTLELIRRAYFWRGMEADVRKHVGECKECMLVKQNSKLSKGFQIGLRPAGFMEEVFIDGYGPFAASATGMRYALTIVEKVSGYCVAVCLAEMNKFEVASALHQHWFAKFGKCKFIISDNGNEFKNKFLATMLKFCGIEHRFSSVYNPRSNLSERVHSVFRACIAIGCERLKTFAHWDYILANAVFCMNNAPMEGRAYSAHEILFGCNWKYPIEEEWNVDEEEEDIGLDMFVGGKRQVLQTVRESIEDTIAALREDGANRVNLARSEHVFAVGDRVGRRLVQHSSEEKHISAKFAVMSSGPYVVQEVNNEGLTLRLASEDGEMLFSMPSRECFHWTAIEEGRYELATPLTRAESMIRGATAAHRDERGIGRVRKNRPRDATHRIDEDMDVEVRDDASDVDENADAWRDYDRSTRRMLQVQESTKAGNRMVLVRGPHGAEDKLRLARVVELTAFGDQGAFAAVHWHDVRLTKVDVLTAAAATETIDLSAKGEWFVDREGYYFEAIPVWSKGTEFVASELQPLGYAMHEEVVPLQRLLGEPFALEKREKHVSNRNRIISRKLWETWKGTVALPLAFRKSIVLTTATRQLGTRSRAGEEELRRLTTGDVKKLLIEQLRTECTRRKIPTEHPSEIGKDGKPVRFSKEMLKRALVDWIQGDLRR